MPPTILPSIPPAEAVPAISSTEMCLPSKKNESRMPVKKGRTPPVVEVLPISLRHRHPRWSSPPTKKESTFRPDVEALVTSDLTLAIPITRRENVSSDKMKRKWKMYRIGERF
jgi:hypothetical protein